MKRKIIILIILLIFNFGLIYGINFANKMMYDNGFMIYLNEHKTEIIDNNEEITEEVPTDFGGEDANKIGKKIDKFLVKSSMEGYGTKIASLSIKKNVNPYLVTGIILESTSCTTDCSIILKMCNNVYESKGTPGCFGGSFKQYESIDSSIEDLVNKISADFYTSDLQNPNKMYEKFKKNAVWAFKVSNYMEKVKNTK